LAALSATDYFANVRINPAIVFIWIIHWRWDWRTYRGCPPVFDNLFSRRFDARQCRILTGKRLFFV
jgi:hypothetical protein